MRWNLHKTLNIYYILVVEDLNAKKVLASLTLAWNEMKFLSSASARGRVEDVIQLIESLIKSSTTKQIIITFITLFKRIFLLNLFLLD